MLAATGMLTMEYNVLPVSPFSQHGGKSEWRKVISLVLVSLVVFYTTTTFAITTWKISWYYLMNENPATAHLSQRSLYLVMLQRTL